MSIRVLLRSLFGAVALLVTVDLAHAQYELRSVGFNPLFQATAGPTAVPGTDPLVPAPSQFASVKATGGAAGPLGLDYQEPPRPLRREYGPRALPNDAAAWSDTEAALAVTSSALGATLQFGDIVTLTGASGYRETRSYNGTTWVIGNVVRYAAAVYSPATATSEGSAVVLVSAVLGAALRPESPRYLFGDVIARPAKTFDGTTDATGELAEYWLSKPVLPGDQFDLGDGTTYTHPGTKGSEPYCFSIHANAVFASQAGRVSITWRSRAKESFTSEGVTVQRYRLKTEEFFVSTASLRPSRTIFWTQKAFNGPAVNIPLGSIEAVRPIYNAAMPAEVRETDEYLPEGGRRELPVEVRTLWFDNSTGQQATLRAYNRTGRLMVEYLGPPQVQPIETGARVFLGADVVDVVQQAPQIDAVVELGERITARDKGNFEVANSAAWIGSPLQSGQASGAGYFNTVTLPDGAKTYYAEKENLSPANVVFYWLERSAPALTSGAAAVVANITLEWPKQKNGYRLIWPDVDPTNPTPGLARYAHNTVTIAGSPEGTGVQFAAGQLPLLAFQDGPAATPQAAVNTSTQRFTVSLSNDGVNRALLRFGSGSDVWYVRVFTQAEDAAGFLEGDGTAAIRANGVANAIVGTRLEPPSSAYVSAGYIASGRGYSEAAYIDPFVAGAVAASRGAIIPVNARPNDKDLVVWWFKVVTPPAGSSFQPFYVPAKIGRYTIRYPSDAPQIVLASEAGSGELSTQEKLGSLYVQNEPTAVGFNPNEEHALRDAGDQRIYALRDDINVTGSNHETYTSEPFVLWSYPGSDGRPAMKVFSVVRTTPTLQFRYEKPVPLRLSGPKPLGPMGVTFDANGKSRNVETTPADTAHEVQNAGVTVADFARYNRFTFEDRTGVHWIYRGPHKESGSATELKMQFYYPKRADFYLPPAVAATVNEGDPLPYLRKRNVATDGTVTFEGDIVAGPPLEITYLPKWQFTDPELEVGDTLALPKSNLPAIFDQKSVQILYQRSVAQGGTTKASVLLHDPISQKQFLFGKKDQETILSAIPKSALTTSSQGKTYFQNLPPHLQKRFYFDPNLGPVGAVNGGLVLKGQLVDEAGPEDYLNLNMLSQEEADLLKGLVPALDGNNLPLKEKPLWDAAITGLALTLNTFVKDPDVPGKFKVGSSAVVNARSLSEVNNSDTAVTDYALTATGYGDGWITLVFNDGRDTDLTPSSNPVDVKTIRVMPRLHAGDLRALKADNPLDEKVTLRHSGDFAGKPEDYEFEWRYTGAPTTTAPNADPAASPFINPYRTGAISLAPFQVARNPAGLLPSTTEYSVGQVVTDVVTVAGTAPQDAEGKPIPGRPLVVLKGNTLADFSARVPDQLVFSAELSAGLGFILYVNGVEKLASNAPGAASSTAAEKGLMRAGLSQQFALTGSAFLKAPNRLEIAVYASKGGTIAGGSAQFQLHTLEDRIVNPVAADGDPVWTRVINPTDPANPEQTLFPALRNIATVGGDPKAPLGQPIQVLEDNYFTVRYRPKTTVAAVTPRMPAPLQAEYAWSKWSKPVLVEGWIKRVLDGINPFNQRMADLGKNSVNTDVSLLTQAGKRWEGDVALSLDTLGVGNVGLIEIYETVLNRGKKISVDADYDRDNANKALMLAAGYLNDLYTILGNEAFADAANPTISVDDSTTATEVSTSRFSFEGQVKSVLEEELALLRGRDNSVQPGVTAAPAYNRLYWNYTRGVNSGEALYAVNYNIVEKSGSTTADGIVDEKDAQRMFPQGHGDAYGHYLTALTGYYRLLRHPNFTWQTRSEQVTVLEQSIEVDYYDERKFAEAAVNVARVAQQVIALTHRQSYEDGKASWAQFQDANSDRGWGLDEWVSRATQGAYYHWMVGNSLLPEKDTVHQGIQKIDRSTVPPLDELIALGDGFQTTLDGANAGLNPLGLNPGAIAFDISPTELKAGNSHYEQIHDRALRAVLNAKGGLRSGRENDAPAPHPSEPDRRGQQFLCRPGERIRTAIDRTLRHALRGRYGGG